MFRGTFSPFEPTVHGSTACLPFCDPSGPVDHAGIETKLCMRRTVEPRVRCTLRQTPGTPSSLLDLTILTSLTRNELIFGCDITKRAEGFLLNEKCRMGGNEDCNTNVAHLRPCRILYYNTRGIG